MPKIKILNASEQVARHLRDAILEGQWKDEMPGAPYLADELGVNHNTMKAAMAQLEKMGLLENQGPGKKRRIILPDQYKTPSMQVGILLYDPPYKSEAVMVETYHTLRDHGHSPFFAGKTLVEMNMDPQRVVKFIKQYRADAWIVVAGSRSVLTHLSELDVPVFAWFGVHRGLPLAGTGPDHIEAESQMVGKLAELGHRRIVALSNPPHTKHSINIPKPAFLEALKSHGLPASQAYNLPTWDHTAEAFHTCLESLFRLTPPTAVLASAPEYFMATLHYFTQRGLRIPQDVSLVAGLHVPYSNLCSPSIAHIHWDPGAITRMVTRWTHNIAHGIEDRNQDLIKARFIEGGTIGPAPKT